MDEDNCSLCNSSSFPGHTSSLKHRFNFALYEWNKRRKAIVKDRHGIQVQVKLCDIVNGNNLIYLVRENKGCHETRLTEEQALLQNTESNGVSYLFTIVNNQCSNSIYLINTMLLHPYSSFQRIDFEGRLDENLILELIPGATYSFKVTFRLDPITVGTYSMPVAIQLQTDKNDEFTITREMLINVVGDLELNQPVVVTTKSPFTSAIWRDVQVWHKPTTRVSMPNRYTIPKKYSKIIKMGINDFPNISREEMLVLQELRTMIAPGYVTKNNYRDFFHTALWADEKGAEIMLLRYNMENVKMNILPGKLLELAVPGLAEKRPSLVNGDIVSIRLHNDHTAYQGCIRAVNDLEIWIEGVESELLEFITEDGDTELDVTFQLGRLPLERMHSGVDRCADHMLDYFFPSETLAIQFEAAVNCVPDYEFLNQATRTNAEQRRAIENIVTKRVSQAPYIVFGPPGTGKTITIVEAILQIVRRKKDVVILVCAPANAACDMLASKLIRYNLSKQELIRVHSDSRDWNTVPDDVKEYSNYIDREYTKPSGLELMKFRVIVTTLILSGRYTQSLRPDYLFIDEAAQALEPEADVAIALLRPGKHLILAGDPKQLGPQCDSAVAEKLHLNVSLLERLMRLPLYMSNNSNFITTLKLNFRAHPVVLQLPNQLFYDNQLQAVSQEAKYDPIATIFIHDKIFGRQRNRPSSSAPLEFCAVFAKEMRQGRSPSYYNPKEADMVLKYIKALTNLTETTVLPAQIGIVTPYIRQVYRIKDALKRSNFAEVEVGTTETFQGREKRIIIISTVRAQHNLLLYDRKYKLGFVKNEKRFNVALTRAMSKLIIIGCPNVLQYDSNWLKYIEFCECLHTYCGPRRDQRTDDLKKDVLNRLKSVHKQDQQHRRNNLQ